MYASSNLVDLVSEDEVIDNPLFHCFVCDVYLSTKEEWIPHASGRAHIAKKTKTLSTWNDNYDICSEIITRSAHLLGDQKKFVEIDAEGDRCTFACVLCDVKVTSYFALGEHLENGSHQTKVNAYLTLKKGMDENATSGAATTSLEEVETTASKMDNVTRESDLNSDNITSAVRELSHFFSGTLTCLNCQRNVEVVPTSVTDHLKSCFSKEISPSKEANTRDKFVAFLQTVGGTSKLDGPQIVSNQQISRCGEFKQRISADAFLNLQSEVARTPIVSPRVFKCTICDVSGNINKWEDHLTKYHSASTPGPRVDLANSIICTCTFCQIMFFGRRENVIKHEHFVTEYRDVFFLLGSYPHLIGVLDYDRKLPRYYTFVEKLTSASCRANIAFYCTACDAFSLDKLKKHFQSKDHKFKCHPMFEFHYCAVCSILFYSDRLLFEDHRRTPLHVFSKFTIKSNSIRASINFVSKGHEDLLSRINGQVVEYWKSQPLNNFQYFAFWCELCAYCSDKKEEWRTVHLISETHASKIKQKECFEHTCVVCKVSLFGSAEFHAAHYSSEGHKNIKTRVFREFNRKRMTKQRSSVCLGSDAALKKLSNGSLSVNNDESSDDSPQELLTESLNVESVKPRDNVARVYDEKSYNLEKDPYMQKLNSSTGLDKKLMKEFFRRIVQRYGPFRRIKNFFCAFCNYYCSSEKSWWPHSESTEHKSALSAYSNDPKNNKNGQLSIIFCSQCLFFGFGNFGMRNVHTNSKNHKKMCIKGKPTKNVASTSSPISFLSTTDEDEDTQANGDKMQPAPSDVKDAIVTNLESTNSSDDEKNEAENVEDELYDMIMREESDAEKIVPSEDELDQSVLKEVKDNVSLNTSIVEEVDRDDNETENRENVDVEYSIVVSGIPAPVMKNRPMLRDAFARYVEFDRTFVRKNKPGSIYLVVSKDLEDSYRRLKQNLVHLKARWGTDELTVDLNTEEKFELVGMRDHLLEPAVALFSDRQELVNAVVYMIDRYDTEANANTTKRRIYELEKDISLLATHIYRNYNMIVKTHVFGSRVIGLAAEHSDVDIYLQIGASFRGLISNNTDLQQQLVLLFSKEMRCHPQNFCDITSIPFARVPIVKFKHIKSNLNCDLSFKSGLSTMNSTLVKTYLELDERIKFVICAVKLWMKLNDLADRNLFTTYAQIWMVLFFLMQADIAVAPTVIKLKNMLPREQQILTVEGWNCSFPSIRNIVWRSSCMLTGEELLHKFFVFYSNISLSNYVLCTLTGLKLEKKHFLKYYDSLPEIFKPFKLRIMEDRALFRKVSSDFESFCVQDPFDHCHNLTKTINIRKFAVFVELCKQTAELLSR